MPRSRVRLLLVAFLSIAALAGIVTAANTIGGPLPGPLPILPADNWWNLDISTAPLDPASAAYVNFIGPTRQVHPDFGGDVSPGSTQVYGFPYAVVDSSVTLRAVQFQYADESDGVDHATNRSVPFYPIPDEAITQAHWVEGGEPGNIDLRSSSDRHMLIVDRDHRYLYELFNVFYDGSQWHAGSGAFFNLNANGRRPEGWTSADAAGLAILPGLVRHDEVFGTGEIGHAFRVTVRATNGYAYPASHRAGSTAGALPMGARLRLKASRNLSGFPPEAQKIFRAMQRYGLIVADNGSDMLVSGAYDTRWDNGVLNPAFHALKASDFEVITLGYQPTATSAPAITMQPTSQAARVGQNAQFTVAASGTPAPTYRWQLSADGGSSWIDLSDNTVYSGASTATLTVANVTAAFNGNLYHAVAANSVGTATSLAATLTIQLFLTPKRFLTDADGDGKSEIAVFRPSIGAWFIRNSSQNYSTGTASVYQWGLSSDVPIAADFDGDGKTELTVFRPVTGEWFIRYSTKNYDVPGYGVYQWGLAGDVPIVGDFDGDGRADLAIFRPSGGGWFIRYSSQAYAVATAHSSQWGLPGDVPIAGDFDGDGKTEIAVFRPSSGSWFIRYSSQAYAVATAGVFQWGLLGDVPLAGDFDGDGKNEIGVFRPSSGEWFIRYSAQNYNIGSFGRYQWGLPVDVPLVADFDGDGKSEIAVYRPPTGEWFIRYSAQSYSISSFRWYQWGLPEDLPIHP
jgi:Ig-like domain-containing protein/VCBS repeat protein